jgi:hypothetical protein
MAEVSERGVRNLKARNPSVTLKSGREAVRESNAQRRGLNDQHRLEGIN